MPSSPRSWRDAIVDSFREPLCRLMLVADPDGLLLEEETAASVRDCGFDVVVFDDPVAFRYVYEAQYRSQWDDGWWRNLSVVVSAGRKALESLPNDLLQAGRSLDFGLGAIFPRLSYPVLRELDRSLLQPVYEACQDLSGPALSAPETCDFILRHAYDLDAAALRTANGLVAALVAHYYKDRPLSRPLAEHMLAQLRSRPALAELPLETMIGDRAGFLDWLQEQWHEFAAGRPVAADLGDGPIRVHLDNYFAEGLLAPEQSAVGQELPGWASVGLVKADAQDPDERVGDLLQIAADRLPAADAHHRDWLRFAALLAKADQVLWEHGHALSEETRLRAAACRAQADASFLGWLEARYGALHSVPFAQAPAMLHHVPHYLAYHRQQSAGKTALLVVDGLSLQQWEGVKQSLPTDLEMTEAATFAWLPTLTSVSRQALISGLEPLFFPDSFRSTDREKTHWQRFWTDHGLTSNQTAYARVTIRDPVESVNSVLTPKTRAACIVLVDVDEIMHGMNLGLAEMSGSLSLWAGEGRLRKLVDLLISEGFEVAVTSDHGNVEARGVGALAQGALVEQRGERVRLYDRTEFRQAAAEKLPETIAWTPPGLPPSVCTLFAPTGASFAAPGTPGVSHGGPSVGEVIVPFVTIRSKSI